MMMKFFLLFFFNMRRAYGTQMGHRWDTPKRTQIGTKEFMGQLWDTFLSQFLLGKIWLEKVKATSCVVTSRFYMCFFGARSGNRTHTVLLPRDFKSLASTNSAIRACGGYL